MVVDVKLNTASFVFESMQAVISFLTLPTAFATFIGLFYKTFQRKQLAESWPLIANQLNITFIWSCVAINSIGTYYYSITLKDAIQSDVFSFRYQFITCFLSSAIQLVPLNIFMYSWRFLVVLENDQENKILKSFYHWFALITILVLPIAFYAVFFAYAVESAYYYEFNFKADLKKADFYQLRV